MSIRQSDVSALLNGLNKKAIGFNDVFKGRSGPQSDLQHKLKAVRSNFLIDMPFFLDLFINKFDVSQFATIHSRFPRGQKFIALL